MSEDKITFDNTGNNGTSNIPDSEDANKSLAKPEDTIASEVTTLDDTGDTPEDTSVDATDEITVDATADTKVETAVDTTADTNTETAVDTTVDTKAETAVKIATATKTQALDHTEAITTKKKSKVNVYKIVRILCLIGFIVFTALFINEVIIQPYRIKKSIDLTRDLYNRPTEGPEVTEVPTVVPTDVVEALPTPVIEATPTPDPNRDGQGRLLQFKDLLATNEDVKGWISIEDIKDTLIDYVVVQSDKENPDYYLDKDIKGDYSKAGTLYIDPASSVEVNTKNIVIHGHNMVSTAEKMFHNILQYKKLSYYQEHPVINFDTIYNTGEWKIFAVFITPGEADNIDFFDYRKSTFKDTSNFLNFVYQIRIRSVLNIDSVDINENDQLLMLSSCSHYELGNYRTVVVARKVRGGEDNIVDVDSAVKNKNPLNTTDYYNKNGGEAPKLADTFEEALENGQISWYTPVAKVAE